MIKLLAHPQLVEAQRGGMCKMDSYFRGPEGKPSCLQSQGTYLSLDGARALEMRIVECGMWIEKIKFRNPQIEFRNLRPMLAAQSALPSGPWSSFHRMFDQLNLEMIQFILANFAVRRKHSRNCDSVKRDP